MKVSDITVTSEPLSSITGRQTFHNVYRCSVTQTEPDVKNRLIGEFSINDLIAQTVRRDMQIQCREHDFSFYGSGWQSWGYGGEIEPGEYPADFIALIPQFKKYTTFPGEIPGEITGARAKLLIGQFIIYLRWGSVYLCIASVGASRMIHSPLRNRSDGHVLPPVQFAVNRQSRTISCMVDAVGKLWEQNELIADLCVFCAENFFELRDTIRQLYGTPETEEGLRFSSLNFLNCSPHKIAAGGWESWYNHYNHINQQLIQDDLHALGKSANIINAWFTGREKPTVFQVDDGWEQGLGQWEADRSLFPQGMTALAGDIAAEGYIPGLWIAPFIIDWRTDFCSFHREWILRDDFGRPVEAGFNFAWGTVTGINQPGKPFSYYCLDLSNDDVIEYVDSLMDKVINTWGFRYIKLDFLFAGMLNGDFKNGGTAYEWYYRALKVITARRTNRRGERVAYLGCGLPFEPSFNCLPLSRIGPDTKEAWDTKSLSMLHFSGRPGAKVNMISTLGHAFWDQSVFINDPDVIFLRSENIALNSTEKELIALVNFLFASQIMHSDDPASFDETTEGSFTRHIMELYDKFDGEEFGLINRTNDTYIIFSRSKKYIGFINLSDRAVSFTNDELFAYAPIDSALHELKPVVSHCQKNEDGSFAAERHSITIFE